MGGLSGSPQGVAEGVVGDHLALVNHRGVGEEEEDRGEWDVK